jgi:diguanylate cyclase (GGDEF)-like protein/PAS domain S-box-containing protein
VEKIAARFRLPLLGTGAALLFLAAAFADHVVALQASGLEAFWPSNAVILAVLILAGHHKRDVVAILAGEIFASILFQALRAAPASLLVTMTFANVSDSFIAFLLLRRMGVRGGLIDRVGNFFALVVACAGAGLVSATVGSTGLWMARSVPFSDGWRGWYVSGLLSAIMVTPSVMILADIVRGRRPPGLDGKSVAEMIGLMGLIAAVTAYVFYTRELPITFIVPPCVLLITFRFRALGALAGVAIVTTIAAFGTAANNGPIALLLRAPADQVLMVQLFVAIILLSTLPVAAVLNERDYQAEETRAFAEHFQSVVENIGEVIFRVDSQGRWAYLNPAWASLTGQPLAASIGRSWLDLIEPGDRAQLVEPASAVLRGEKPSTRRGVRLKTPSGLRWVEVFVQGLHDKDGRIAGATGTLRDIDDRKRLEEHVITAKRRAEQRAREATLLASTDELTGIANRRAFMGQLDREIEGAVEFGWPLAVAMFDVDHFKAVNDCYGHAVGDRVLQLIAARAAAVVRGGDLVGRLGGEEFGILMPGASLEEAARVAERLRQAMETAREIDESLPGVTISVGVAVREAQRSAADLLAAADVALYAAKGDGRNRVRVAA